MPRGLRRGRSMSILMAPADLGPRVGLVGRANGRRGLPCAVCCVSVTTLLYCTVTYPRRDRISIDLPNAVQGRKLKRNGPRRLDLRRMQLYCTVKNRVAFVGI